MAVTNSPKITIITPVKNSVKTLEKAIESVIKQNYPNLEYIILDGGSTDGTLDIIKKYENFFSHWESKDDGSSVVAYIEGIKKSQSEIIAFLNADDFYEADVLSKVAEEFVKDPSLDIVSFLYRVLKNENEKLQVIEETAPASMDLDRNKIIHKFGINARFFKKELFYKYGLPLSKDDQGRNFVSNDVEYMIRFVLRGVRNKTVDYVAYNYLSHENSLTFSNSLETKIRLNEDKIFIAKIFLNSNEFVGDFDLPKIWEKTFKKWIKKYRATLVAGYLKQGNWNKVKENFWCGVKECGFLQFVVYVSKTFLRRK